MYCKSFLVGSPVHTLYRPLDGSRVWYSGPAPQRYTILEESIFCQTAASTFPKEAFTLAHANSLTIMTAPKLYSA